MAEILNPADLTLSPDEIREIKQAIYVEIYALPQITEFLTPYEGIINDEQIVFLGTLDGLVGQGHSTAQCAPVENEAGIDNTEKFWEPKYWDDRFSECWDKVEGFFKLHLKPGTDIGDLTSTEFGDFFVERYKEALAEMFFRFVWFGDTDAATISASPAGVFVVAGFAAKRWNLIDGIWKQIFAAVAADSTRKSTGLVSKNGQATFALQEFDDTDTTNRVVTKLLGKMQRQADSRLKTKAEKIFIVTQSVADQYEEELEAATGLETAFEYVQEGVKVLKRRGVTIYAFEFWDRMIRTYMRNSTGLGYYLPHRALLTVKKNLAFGTREVGAFKKVDAFYDKVTAKTYFDIAGNLDAKLLQDYLFQAAY